MVSAWKPLDRPVYNGSVGPIQTPYKESGAIVPAELIHRPTTIIKGTWLRQPPDRAA